MIKYFFTFCITTLSFLSAFANHSDSTKVEKINIDFSGFLRVDYWYDSRQANDVVGDIDCNNKGETLNSKISDDYRALMVVQYSF